VGLPRPTTKVIFSRKGFDSAAGKVASPIIEGEPISLPIPTGRYGSETSYSIAGCGEIVERVTRGRILASALCHEDPMYWNGRWAFGQTGAAQAHLENNGVGVGDVFLFYGLFALDGRDRHHRIFGYLKVEEVRLLGSRPSKNDNPDGFPRRHPHTIGGWDANNTLYLGLGFKARTAPSCLRLTKPGALVSAWNVPTWLKAAGLTYNSNPTRWVGDGELHVALRGQEFVTDIGEQSEPLKWLHDVKAAIRQ
jgi:putative DNA base modification enzyme with NMAD domain